MSSDLLALLPAETVARALPDVELVETAAGEMVHLLMPDRATPLCGTSTVTAPLVDATGRRVCVSCARRLPRPVRVHLSTAGHPTEDEMAPMHVRRARLASERYCADMEDIRLDAVLDGTAGHQVLAEDGGHLLTFGGPAVGPTAMTVGLYIGTLLPAGDRARPPTSPASIRFAPQAPGRFPVSLGPLGVLQQQAGSRR